MKHQYTKGRTYTKRDVGVEFPLTLSSVVIHPIDGEEYFFITLNNDKKYRNGRHGTDIIVEPGGPAFVQPVGNAEPREAYCFVREESGDEFTYEGIVTAVEGFDPGRNILRVV